MLCPFCYEANNEQAVVCRTCQRDIVIPSSLKAEHREISLKRDLLRAELNDAKTKLGTRRRWVRALTGL
jgi:hypothetical protein